MISTGRIGPLECDFVMRDNEMNYSYVQVAYTIADSKDTEEREYRALESITRDKYPRYLLTCDRLTQRRNGVIHASLTDFIAAGRRF